jgi:uncharacterized OB-fold protein
MSREIAAPTPTPETEEFWKAGREGRFLLRRCTACNETHWYPRAICPHCSGDTVWEEAQGTGVIYSWTVMRRAPEPFAIAYVTLDAGPTMFTNLVDCDLDALRIGAKVRLVWVPSKGGQPVPCFTPV